MNTDKTMTPGEVVGALKHKDWKQNVAESKSNDTAMRTTGLELSQVVEEIGRRWFRRSSNSSRGRKEGAHQKTKEKMEKNRYDDLFV